MSDKIMYCDREPYYDGFSSEILRQLYNDSKKTKYLSSKNYEEFKCLKQYDVLFSEYHRMTEKSLFLQSCLKKKASDDLLSQIHEIDSKRSLLYDKLATLEDSQSIQEFIRRATNPNMKIKMQFSQKNSVFSHNSPERQNHIKTNQSQETIPKPLIIPLVVAGILFISIAELPYGFYTFMRIVVPLLSTMYLFFAYLKTGEFNLTMIPNILIAILWNPIIPVYLDKGTWVIIDIIFGIGEIAMTIYAYHSEKSVD